MPETETISLTEEQLFLLKQATALDPESEPAIFAEAIDSIQKAEAQFEQLAKLNPRCEHLVHLARTCKELASIDFRASLPGVYRLISV